MDNRALWARARDELTEALASLGYPEELGDMIAKYIGSPKGIKRMTSYLRLARPDKMELIADEMISVKSDIDRWRERIESREANIAYNEMLNRGLDEEDENKPLF